MKDIIGLDIGTSSIKGIRISENGKIRMTAREKFTYRYPGEGQVEIAAKEYLDTCCRLLRRLAAAGGGAVAAVCTASASGNLLVLNKQGEPVTPVINWQDTRVGEEAERLLKGYSDREIYEAVGWPMNYQGMCLAQLCRLRCHSPELLDGCGMICMSTEYLYWRLGGQWRLSSSAGTPFYLLDQRTGRYNGRLLKILNIDESRLPPIGKAGEIAGYITEEGAALSGLSKGTPLVLGTFDHPAAARGAGVFSEGQMLLSCGTSWVGFFPVRDRERILSCGVLADPFYAPRGCWGAMVSIPSVSERIKYVTKRYVADGDELFTQLDEQAALSGPGAGGLTIDLYGELPDEEIRRFSRRDIARAIMEGTVRLLDEKIKKLAEQGICTQEAVMVGGPSESPVWQEVISQMTGLKLRTAKGAYTGAAGAAVIAAAAMGAYGDEQAAYRALLQDEGGKSNVCIKYDGL